MKRFHEDLRLGEKALYNENREHIETLYLTKLGSLVFTDDHYDMAEEQRVLGLLKRHKKP